MRHVILIVRERCYKSRADFLFLSLHIFSTSLNHGYIRAMLSQQSDLYVGVDHFLMLTFSSSSPRPCVPCCYYMESWGCLRPTSPLSFSSLLHLTSGPWSILFPPLYPLFLPPFPPPPSVMLKPRFDPFCDGSNQGLAHAR